MQAGGTISHCYNTGMLKMGGHVDIAYSDIGGWVGGPSHNNCGTLAGWEETGGVTGTVTDSYYLKDISVTGAALDHVQLTDLFRAYPAQHFTWSGAISNISLGGWQSYSSITLDPNGVYYAFYDVTNDQVIALQLEGEGSGEATIDARNLGGGCDKFRRYSWRTYDEDNKDR